MPIVTVAELEKRIDGSITGDAVDRAEAILEDAEAMVLAEGNPEWDTDTIPDRARSIIYQAAKREWVNPNGVSQVSVGDASQSFSRPGIQGTMYLTKAEQRTVRRLAGTSFIPAQYEDPYPPRIGYSWFVEGTQ